MLFARNLVGRFGFHLVLTVAALTAHAGGEPPENRIDCELVRETVESLAALVQQEYFDPDTAARVDASLREWLAQGRYADPHTLESLADVLTRDLYAATRDKHLAVAVVEEAGSGPPSDPVAGDDSREVDARRSNFGVQRVEILAGNVGYLNIISFYRPDEARDTVSAAMRTLRHADALILDLRDNSGGSPDTVALVASYFFDTPKLLLFEIIPRSGDEGRQYTTTAPPLPELNAARPVYALTSERTFSAGEGLAFVLQEQDRAEVVGEKTAGAANPGRPYRINARFEVTIPNGKVRSAVSGRNWEGRGVVPDVGVSAADALHVAHVRALGELLRLAPDGPWHDTLSRELKQLEQSDR